MSTISKAVKALGRSGIWGTTPSKRAKSLLGILDTSLLSRNICSEDVEITRLIALIMFELLETLGQISSTISPGIT